MGAAANNQTKQKPRKQITQRERERIAEKNKRKRIRRKRFVIFSLLFIILAVIAGLAYGFFAIFRITTYTVEGSITYSAEQVFESSGIAIGKNLFLSDIKSAEKSLETALPYIGKAEIRRNLPGTLKYILTETEAVCVIENDAGVLLIDKEGKALEQKTDTGEKPLTVLKCPALQTAEIGKTVKFPVGEIPESANPLDVYKNLVAEIQKSGLADITLMDMTDISNLSLVYQGRINMHIGTPTYLESRLSAAKLIIDNANTFYPPGQKGKIDLTILELPYFQPDNEN